MQAQLNGSLNKFTPQERMALNGAVRTGTDGKRYKVVYKLGVNRFNIKRAND